MDLLAADTVPFVAALGVTLAIVLVELAGLLVGAQISAALDSVLPDWDVDGPDTDAGSLSQLLSWLNFGRLPALAVLVLLCTAFGVLGLAEQEAARRVFGATMHPLLASIPAAIGAVVATRYLGRALARILPREETDAVSTQTFVGRIATVFRGIARPGAPAEAKLTDQHGKTHYLLVEPDADEPDMPEGSQVLIVGQRGPVYRAITRLKPLPAT